MKPDQPKKADALGLARVAGKLKSLNRAGWVLHHVPQPESVADHSFRLSILALALAKEFGADEAKTVKMALLHDLGEAIIGDVITQRGAKNLPNRAEKLERERTAFREIASLAGLGADWTSLFDELQANQSPEAKLVNQLDRLEAAVQAVEYSKQYGLDPTEWLENTSAHLQDPRLRSLLEQLSRQ